MKYECTYWAYRSFEERKRGFVWANSLEDLKSGFWVNKKFEFTKGEDSMMWIPPSQIMQITKLKSR